MATHVYTFRRFFDGWLEAVHVVASVTVVTEQQLILATDDRHDMVVMVIKMCIKDGAQVLPPTQRKLLLYV